MMVTDPQTEILKSVLAVVLILLAVVIFTIAIALYKNPKRKHKQGITIISTVLILVCIVLAIFLCLQ